MFNKGYIILAETLIIGGGHADKAHVKGYLIHDASDHCLTVNPYTPKFLAVAAWHHPKRARRCLVFLIQSVHGKGHQIGWQGCAITSVTSDAIAADKLGRV